MVLDAIAGVRGWRWMALVFALFVRAGEVPAQVDSLGCDFRDRIIDFVPFDVGERLEYRVKYGVISAGSAEMAIKGLEEVNGRLCFHAMTTIRSNSFFSRFFKVRDRVESYIDRAGIYPWRFEKHLREGKYQADVRSEYDHAGCMAIVNGDTVRIPPMVQDVLSIFYYVRTESLKVGRTIEVANHDNRKVAVLELKVLRRERIRTPAGEFGAFLIEPRLKETGESAGLFRQKGEAWIWFSDDERRLPVLIKSKLYFGSLTLELVGAHLPRLVRENDLSSAEE